MATFVSVVMKYLKKFYLAIEELDTMKAKNLLTLQRQCAEYDKMLEPLKDLAIEVMECDLVGGELLNFLYTASENDRYSSVAGMLQQMFSLGLKRYYETLYEWVVHCSLTKDTSHEVGAIEEVVGRNVSL